MKKYIGIIALVVIVLVAVFCLTQKKNEPVAEKTEETVLQTEEMVAEETAAETVAETVIEISDAMITEDLDYADAANWAILPESEAHDVDVFFICPTATSHESCQMDLADEPSRTAFHGATMMEKGIYDEEADFYAPYYRQMTLQAYDYSPEERMPYLEVAYADIETAFTYYMDNYNDGDPIILAGFSQGGELTKMLMINHPEIMDQLVAAYIIGWNVTDEDLESYSQLQMAEGSDDTGVIVSFCSESEDLDDSIIVPETTNGINPLNWKTDQTVATKEENLGACFTNYDGDIVNEIPQLCGCYRDPVRGTLKVTDVTPEEYPAKLTFLKDGNYHIYDYQFFYRNLQENVKERIAAFAG